MRSSALCLLHAGQLEADAVSYLHTEGPNNLTLINLVVQVYLLLELLFQKRTPLSIAKQQHWNSLILFELWRPGTFFVLQTDQCPPDFKHLQTNPKTISADSAVNPAYGLGQCKWECAGPNLSLWFSLCPIVRGWMLQDAPRCSKATCLSVSTTTIYMFLGTANQTFVSVLAQIDWSCWSASIIATYKIFAGVPGRNICFDALRLLNVHAQFWYLHGWGLLLYCHLVH